MKRVFIFLVLSLASCVKSPMRVGEEIRFSDGILGGFSSRVLAQSGLASDGKRLFFGTRGGTLYALDAGTGKKLWKKKLSGSIDTTPAIGEGSILVGTATGRCYALSIQDGREIWNQEVLGEVLGTPHFLENKAAVFGVNDGALYAFSLEDGHPLWRYHRNLPDRMTIHSFAPMAVASDRLYAGFSDGTVVALRGSDGEEVWHGNLTSGGRFLDVVAPLIPDSDRIWATQFDGNLFALNSSGAILWSFPKGGTAAASVIDGDMAWIPGSDQRVVAVDSRSGESRWTYTAAQKATWSGLTKFNNWILAATLEGELHVIDAKTGARIWTYNFGAPLQGAPVTVGTSIWVLSREGELYRLEPR